MLRAGRPDDRGRGRGRGAAQSFNAEGVGVVRSDRFGGTGHNGGIDRGAPNNMPRIAELGPSLSHSEDPSASSSAAALTRGKRRQSDRTGVLDK